MSKSQSLIGKKQGDIQKIEINRNAWTELKKQVKDR